jgi:hypothetical protein
VHHTVDIQSRNIGACAINTEVRHDGYSRVLRGTDRDEPRVLNKRLAYAAVDPDSVFDYRCLSRRRD